MKFPVCTIGEAKEILESQPTNNLERSVGCCKKN
jgi:hypothetical protein